MGDPIRMFNSLELISTTVLLTTYSGPCGGLFVSLGDGMELGMVGSCGASIEGLGLEGMMVAMRG